MGSSSWSTMAIDQGRHTYVFPQELSAIGPKLEDQPVQATDGLLKRLRLSSA